MSEERDSSKVLRDLFNKEGDALEVTSKDSSNLRAQNSIFGETIIGRRIAYIASQFVYGINEDNSIITETNGGTISVSDNLLIGATGTNTAGVSSIETRRYVRYIPGHDILSIFTAVFSEPKTDSYQHIGLFTSQDGVFIGYNESGEFCLFRRRKGTTYEHVIDLEDRALDPKKGALYRLNFGYLGFSPIILSYLGDDYEWEVLKVIKYQNSNTETSLGSTYLPVRGEVGNTGNDTNITLGSSSVYAGLVDGGAVDKHLTDKYNLYSRADVSITSGDIEVVTFKAKTTFNGSVSKIACRLSTVDLATDLNKNAIVKLEKNATITNSPSWTDIDTGTSVMEYSTDATITPGTGNMLVESAVPKEDNFTRDFEDKDFLLFPGETATFYITTSGAGEINFSNNWFELF